MSLASPANAGEEIFVRAPQTSTYRQRYGPHIIQTSIPVVAGEDPQLFVVNGRTVGTPRHRHRSARELPFAPLRIMEPILEQVVFVGQIRVGVNVARVAAEHEHGTLIDDGRVMVAGGRRGSGGQRSTPGLVFHIEPYQIARIEGGWGERQKK